MADYIGMAHAWMERASESFTEENGDAEMPADLALKFAHVYAMLAVAEQTQGQNQMIYLRDSGEGLSPDGIHALRKKIGWP